MRAGRSRKESIASNGNDISIIDSDEELVENGWIHTNPKFLNGNAEIITQYIQ